MKINVGENNYPGVGVTRTTPLRLDASRIVLLNATSGQQRTRCRGLGDGTLCSPEEYRTVELSVGIQLVA